MAASLVLLAVAALIVGLETDSDQDEAGLEAAPSAEIRGCQERIEGPRLTPDRRDTAIGPITFGGLPRVYRNALATAKPGEEPAPMKVITLLRAGSTVTLNVPPDERAWMVLLYLPIRFEPSAPLQGQETAVTLEACEKVRSERAQRRECHWEPYRACESGLTQFNGGFFIDFKQAPQEGRCARLEVWVEGKPTPLVVTPFSRRSC